MKKIAIATAAATMPRAYKNFGQHAEQVVRYHFTGEIVKADNIPFSVAGDYDGMQIKTRKATICVDMSLDEYLAKSAAACYGIVTEDFVLYVMTPVEFRAFAKMFGYTDYDNHTKKASLRLRGESVHMREYLAKAAR